LPMTTNDYIIKDYPYNSSAIISSMRSLPKH